MISIGAVVVDEAAAGRSDERPNQTEQGTLLHDIARASSGPGARWDQSSAAAASPGAAGVAGESQQEIAGKAEAMFVA
jgi:hypothetical protein